MSKSWERLAAATGIGFVVLLVVQSVLLPQKNTFKETINQIAANQNTARLVTYLGGLALVLFIWFVAALWAHLRRAEGSPARMAATAFGGGLAATVVALVGGGVVLGALVHDIGHFSGGTGRVFYEMYGASFGFAIWFPMAVLVEATSLAAIRHGAFPKAWGWIGTLVALWFVVSPGLGVYSEPDSASPTGLITFVLFMVWVLVTSIMLVGRVGKEPAQMKMEMGG